MVFGCPTQQPPLQPSGPDRPLGFVVRLDVNKGSAVLLQNLQSSILLCYAESAQHYITICYGFSLY